MFKWITIGNAIIELGWIAATVCLILNEHDYWAGATLFGAIFSGYSYKSRNKKEAEDV